MKEVKDKPKRVPRTRISSKHQITIPVAALQEAGLRVEGAGRVVLERETDVIAEFSGCLTGVWAPDEIQKLREEWD